MGISSFLHVKLDISDIRCSLDFYYNKLKFLEVCRYELSSHVIIQVSPTGKPPALELWYEQSQVLVPNDRIHIAFEVDDIYALARDLNYEGVELEREPFILGHEIIAFIRDPDGYLIELNQDTTRHPVTELRDEEREINAEPN
jgi:lactoylglutathione lyase